MINYKFDKSILEPIIGTNLLQFFLKGGLFQLGDSTQIDSTDELILIFQKKAALYVKISIKFDGPLFSIEKDKVVDIKTKLGAYPAIDFDEFNCAINNPLDGLVSSIEIFYDTMENVDNVILNYFKGIVIKFTSKEKVIIQSSDSPKSFSIFFDDSHYQLIAEQCKERVFLGTEHDV